MIQLNLNHYHKCALLIILSALTLIVNVKAQGREGGYTQYMSVLTPLNPAYSLVDKAGSIDLLTRKQLVGIDGAPTTLLFNLNLPLPNINGSMGLSVQNESIAIERQTEINAYFAKAIQLSEGGFLAVSLNAGVRNYAANYSTLDSADPSFKNDVRQTTPNIGFGVMYFTDTYYIGLSLPELTINTLGTASVQQSVNFKNNYYLAAAYLMGDEDFKFKPATLISYANGANIIANISGTVYVKSQFGLGFNYRTDKEAAGILTVNFDAFRIGYSYQFGTSSTELGGINNATHEVTFTYRFGKNLPKGNLL